MVTLRCAILALASAAHGISYFLSFINKPNFCPELLGVTSRHLSPPFFLGILAAPLRLPEGFGSAASRSKLVEDAETGKDD